MPKRQILIGGLAQTNEDGRVMRYRAGDVVDMSLETIAKLGDRCGQPGSYVEPSEAEPEPEPEKPKPVRKKKAAAKKKR